MAIVKFTEEEVRAALPREHKFNEDGTYGPNEDKVGTSHAWEIYSSYPESADAADFINAILVKVLTTEPVEVDLTDIDDEVDGFNGRLSSVVCKALRGKFGQTFGFTDTEPRYKMHMFVRRLFGDA